MHYRFLSVALTAITFLFVLNLAAQNTSPYWSLAGNSNASTSSKLGTTNAIPFNLTTSNLTRIHIATDGKVGIGTISPASRLTVNSASGESPLRASIAGNTKLLLASNGGLAVGISAIAPANGLYVNGSVGIGTAIPASGYKLHVVGKGQFTTGLHVGNGGIFGINSAGTGVHGSGSSRGVYGTSPAIGVYGASTDSTYGVYGESAHVGVFGNGRHYGVHGAASTTGGWGVYGTGKFGVYGSGSSWGVFGSGGHTGVAGSGSTSGVRGSSTDGNGVYGYSTNGYGGLFHSVNSHGIYATTDRNDNNYAAVFNGNTYSYNNYLGSDKSLKHHIEEFSDALGIINKLKPKHYEFRQDGSFAEMNLPRGKHYGLIAQELEEVLPSLVKEAPHPPSHARPQALDTMEANGQAPGKATVPHESHGETTKETLKIKAVNYTELIPILVKGMQELSKKDEEIDHLKEENKLIKAEVAELRKIMLELKNSRTGSVNVTSAYLEQNTPNPVSSTTRISYSIPETSASAKLTLTNTKGQVIKTYSLNNRGVGQLNLNTASLAAGTYNYTLYVDGKQADTKRLVITR